MAGRVGRRVDGVPRLASVSRPMKPSSLGSGSRGGNGTGGTYYPTVLEAYNRDSDYRRWRSGLDYWQGSGKSWGDLQRFYLLRSFRDYGTRPGPQLVSATYFPSDSSPEGAWTVVCRRRGALILPQPLNTQDVSLDLDLQPLSQHRLILNVSSTLNADQIAAWQAFIGDQFEDSAIGASYPQGIIVDPIDTIAYTLVEVDPVNGHLLFDLSRPYLRRRPNNALARAFWQRAGYDPRAPLLWRTDGSRYLCSSHRLFCNCPDFSGGRIADLSGQSDASQQKFPRPGAGRTMVGRWESEGVGYRTRWRDLPVRADRRRECKHVHAVRWSLGYPFYEPSDYEIGAEGRQFQGFSGGSLTSEQVIRYQTLRELTADRLAIALADSAGIAVDSRDTIPENEAAPAQAGRQPILWTSQREPEAFRALEDDWWVQRGSKVLRVFDPVIQRFTESRVIGGKTRLMIEQVEEGSPVPQEP